MATAQFPFRAPQEEMEELKRRAHARGLSVNAYMRQQLALDRDETDSMVRSAIVRTYARTAFSPELDDLDAQLAAVPRPTSAELGFDPDTAADDDTAAA
jgi:hypothetical protein